MATTPDSPTPDTPTPERLNAGEMAAAAFSVLLLLAAAFVLLQFTSRPWPKQAILGTPIPLAILATLLVMSGSIAVLTLRLHGNDGCGRRPRSSSSWRSPHSAC